MRRNLPFIIIVSLAFLGTLIMYSIVNAQYGQEATDDDRLYLAPGYKFWVTEDGQIAIISVARIGDLLVSDALKAPVTSSRGTCNSDSKGFVVLDESDNTWYGCNGTEWKELDFESSEVTPFDPSAATFRADQITGVLSIAQGGTGFNSRSAARTNLGLQIGVNGQEFDSRLQEIAGDVLRFPEQNSNGSSGNSNRGEAVFNLTDSRAYICNGTSWKIIAIDADRDGHTEGIDEDDSDASDNGDSQLIAGNIRNGVNIFGVVGTYVRPNEPNLLSGNIRSGVSIYGVVGNVVPSPSSIPNPVTFTSSNLSYSWPFSATRALITIKGGDGGGGGGGGTGGIGNSATNGSGGGGRTSGSSGSNGNGGAGGSGPSGGSAASNSSGRGGGGGSGYNGGDSSVKVGGLMYTAHGGAGGAGGGGGGVSTRGGRSGRNATENNATGGGMGGAGGTGGSHYSSSEHRLGGEWRKWCPRE